MCFEQCYWDVNRCLPKGRLLEPEIRSILQWESHRSMYGRGCFEMCSVVFYLHWVVKLGFLIIVFGKCSCRKSIQEWGKGLHFSSCTFIKCELFAWLLLYYWSLSCEYTVQEIVGGGFVYLWGLFWEILSQINLKRLSLTFEMEKLYALNHPCSTHFVNLRSSILCLWLNLWRKC